MAAMGGNNLGFVKECSQIAAGGEGVDYVYLYIHVYECIRRGRLGALWGTR